MVKKITVYTAFRQFFEMVQRQAEREMEQRAKFEKDAACTDLQVQSCPIPYVPTVGNIRKAVSCPLVALVCSPPVVSPVPTSIESRKLNEATDMMLSFWKHMSARQEDIPSLFEKLDGFFAATPSISAAPSGPFDDTGFTEPLSLVTESEMTECAFCNSMKAIDGSVAPTLPVFVKSPIDSLTYYKKTKESNRKRMEALKDGNLADDESTESNSTSSLLPLPRRRRRTTSTSSSNNEEPMAKRARLLGEVIEQQNKTIALLLELNAVNAQL